MPHYTQRYFYLQRLSVFEQRANCECSCRLYIEQYSDDQSTYEKDAQEVLGPIIQIALKLSKLQEFTGRDKPTVIT